MIILVYICGIGKKSGENVKDPKKIKLSAVTELSKVVECYEALNKNKLFYEENDDFFIVFRDEDSRETNEKESKNAAGRLCAKITSLIMVINEALESKDTEVEVDKIIERKFLDKVNTQIILDKFAKSLKLSAMKLGEKK